MMQKKRLSTGILIFICYLIPVVLKAQMPEIRQGIQTSSIAYYGFILPHHPEMKVFTDHHIQAWEIDLAETTMGSKRWQWSYAYPVLGASLFYSNLGQTGILGEVFAAIPYVDFPLLRGKESSLMFRFGTGLGWFTQTFDRISNYKNTAIGSHLNAAISLQMAGDLALAPRLSFRPGLSFIHFSNGATRVPNYGINFVAVNAGFSYMLVAPRGEHIVWEPKPVKPRPEFLTIVTGTVKEIFPVGGEKYFAGNLAIDVRSMVSNHFLAGAGLDITYDVSDREVLRRLGKTIKDLETLKYALNVHGGVQLGRLDLCLHVGAYLYQEDTSDGWIYDKITATYNLYGPWLLNLTLKTHFARADFVAGGIGFKL
ncbi:MAG: acyloxyacyl hydrolase [Bacteroidales bacterium]